MIDLSIIQIENEKLKGTNDYNKYYMPCDNKTNGKWHFIGWYAPMEKEATVKKVKDKYYLMIGKDSRYELTEEVNKLINAY